MNHFHHLSNPSTLCSMTLMADKAKKLFCKVGAAAAERTGRAMQRARVAKSEKKMAES
jgi:hypothetical protein